MPTPDAPTEELASFAPALAEAVAAVLSEAGVPTILGEAPDGELSVLVPRERRGEALAALAARMDEIQARATGDPRYSSEMVSGCYEDSHVTGGEWAYGEAAESGGPPLVLDRFRSLGWVAVALVPLLIIGLARVRLPAMVVLLLMIGSVVLVAAWRSGRFGGDG